MSKLHQYNPLLSPHQQQKGQNLSSTLTYFDNTLLKRNSMKDQQDHKLRYDQWHKSYLQYQVQDYLKKQNSKVNYQQFYNTTLMSPLITNKNIDFIKSFNEKIKRLNTSQNNKRGGQILTTYRSFFNRSMTSNGRVRLQSRQVGHQANGSQVQPIKDGSQFINPFDSTNMSGSGQIEQTPNTQKFSFANQSIDSQLPRRNFVVNSGDGIKMKNALIRARLSQTQNMDEVVITDMSMQRTSQDEALTRRTTNNQRQVGNFKRSFNSKGKGLDLTLSTFQQFSNKYRHGDTSSTHGPENLVTDYEDTNLIPTVEGKKKDKEWNQKFQTFLKCSYKSSEHEQECADEIEDLEYQEKPLHKKAQNLLEEIVQNKRQKFAKNIKFFNEDVKAVRRRGNEAVIKKKVHQNLSFQSAKHQQSPLLKQYMNRHECEKRSLYQDSLFQQNEMSIFAIDNLESSREVDNNHTQQQKLEQFSVGGGNASQPQYVGENSENFRKRLESRLNQARQVPNIIGIKNQHPQIIRVRIPYKVNQQQ